MWKATVFVYLELPYSKDYVKNIFHRYNLDENESELSTKEIIMKKDGAEILFFKEDELFNAQLVEDLENGETKYRYDKIIISGKEYDVTPGMLLGIELMKRLTNN